MHADEINALTEQVLAAAFEVSNTLGPGFLEKVYERAMARDLELRGIKAATQTSFTRGVRSEITLWVCS